MNKKLLVFGTVSVIVVGFLLFVPKVKRTNLGESKIGQSTPTLTTAPTDILKECFSLSIVSPKPKEKVTSPISVSAIVNNADKKCHWTVFEGQAGKVKIVDAMGKVLGEGILKTTEDWTAEKKIEFTSTVSFIKPKVSNNLTLVAYEENPSGKPNINNISIPLSY